MEIETMTQARLLYLKKLIGLFWQKLSDYEITPSVYRLLEESCLNAMDNIESSLYI